MKYTKLKLITCLALIVLMLAGTITVYAAKEKNGDYTGNWQFVNTIEDIPISGHVLLSHAKDTKNLFYGELSASESNKVTDSLNNTQLQIQDETKKSFMLIQDGQSFYIQLADGTYLKREGNLTNATLSQTDDIALATKFRIEHSGFGTNGYSYYKIFEPYELTTLNLVVTDKTISLSADSYSGFYMMAEATKIKVPPFGDFTKIARFIATMVTVALLIVVLVLYRKNILNLITFGICCICLIAFLVLFMIFAITTEEPGLYVLHKSTFKAEALTPYELAETPANYYEIASDGSAMFSFAGEENSAYIWGANIGDDSIFTTTSSGKYTAGYYNIWLRPFGSGSHDIVFYYYDVTKGMETARTALKYHIELNEQNQIISIQPYSNEV